MHGVLSLVIDNVLVIWNLGRIRRFVFSRSGLHVTTRFTASCTAKASELLVFHPGLRQFSYSGCYYRFVWIVRFSDNAHFLAILRATVLPQF